MSKSDSSKAVDSTQIADQLRQVRVSTRKDLHVVRTLFRGKVAFVISDPLTFQSFRLDTRGYSIFIALHDHRVLGDVFQDLVETGQLTEEKEKTFYDTILLLHRLNFLKLPISDDVLLYQRYLSRIRNRMKEKLLGILFLRIPVFNPDIFLNKIRKRVAFLFSGYFFLFWLALMAVSALLAMGSAHRLLEPVQGILAAGNLPFIFTILIALKVVHEFGHACACKHFNGHVPQIGIFLVVFTPLAYVDVSSSWGFPRKRDRIIVGLGGMYFESMIAAAALWIWFFTQSGMIHDMAYNVVFLAGVATVLFNMNPLMRYDGYYILSDLLEIPNLRQRAVDYVKAVLKGIFLGLKGEKSRESAHLRILLFTFGVAASLYRIVLVMAISTAIASKLLIAGLAIAGVYVTMTLVSLFVKTSRYLFFNEETAVVRIRACLVGFVFLAVTPAAVMTIPVPGTTHGTGIFEVEDEKILRAECDGFIEKILVTPGQCLASHDRVVELSNDACREAIAQAATQVEVSRIRCNALRVTDLEKALEEEEKMKHFLMELRQREAEKEKLNIIAGQAGRVVDCLGPRDGGRYIKKGEPLCTLGSDAWQIRSIMTEEEFFDAGPGLGDVVKIIPSANPEYDLHGVIKRIIPSGTRQIPDESFTQLGGGSIPVDSATLEASEPYFEIIVKVEDPTHSWIRHGMTCQVRCRERADTLGTVLTRQLKLILAKFLHG